jgi:biotin transporter BioY
VLFVVASAACVTFIVLILTGVPLAWATGTCAAAVLIGFAIRDRGGLRWGLVPVRLLCGVVRRRSRSPGRPSSEPVR